MNPSNAALFSICLLSYDISALPQDLRGGDCQISESLGKMVVESADGAHLKWTSFNIDPNETVQFALPSDRACVINQVMEHNPSRLMGSLLSNGKVFLLNPAGVLIGKEAKIDTAAFIVSTFDHIERSSKNALGWKLTGKSDGKITIEGDISSQNGPIVVVGENIDCQGTIQALNGSAYLLGTNTCFIGDDDGVLWTDILPQGSEITVSGRVFAKSEAHVLADLVVMDKEALIDVSGQDDHCGGKAFINGFGAAHVFGHIASKGGASGGDGGFIEVSGGYLNFQGTVDTTAPQGETGHLLLDPFNIRIGGGVDTNVTGASPYTPTASPSIISQGTLSAALALANVTVQSTGGAGADPGDVFLVDDYFAGTPTGTTLTLLAFHDIYINAVLSFLTPGSLVLQAPNGSVLIGNAPTVPAQTGGALLFVNSGNITISALNDVIVDAAGFSANIQTPSGNISVTTVNGDVQVLGGAGVSEIAQIGMTSAPAASDITINTGGDVVVTAGTGPNSTATIGLGAFAASAGALTGDISITAQGNVNVSGSSGLNSYGLIGFKNGDTVDAVNIDGTVTVRADGTVNVTTGSDDRGNGVIGLLGFDAPTENWIISVDVESNGPFNITAPLGNATGGIGVIMDIFVPVPNVLTITSPLVRVVSHSPLPCTMTGSTSLLAGRAYIGFEQSGSLAGSNFQNILVQTVGDLQFGAGFSSVIGFASDVTPNMFGNVTVNIGGDFLMGPTGRNAVIAYTSITPGSEFNTVTVTARNILATLGGPGGFLASSTGSTTINVVNDIQIQTTTPGTIGMLQGLNGITVIAGNDIIMTPAALDPTGGISINDTAGVGPIYVEAGRDIIFNSASGGAGFSTAVLDFSFTSTTIDVVAGRNLFLGDNSAVISFNNSSINLVCDNQFPVFPQIGPGRLDMSVSSLVGMQGKGEIRLFTALQNQNTVLGQFTNGGSNTTGLVLGPLFADIPPEKWGIYYFNTFYYTDSIFTIFYKQAFQEITEVANLVVSEVLYGLNDFDDYLEWPELWNGSGKDSSRFKILYDQTSKKSGMKYSENEEYWIPRRKSRFLQHPQVYRS